MCTAHPFHSKLNVVLGHGLWQLNLVRVAEGLEMRSAPEAESAVFFLSGDASSSSRAEWSIEPSRQGGFLGAKGGVTLLRP